MDVIFLLLCFFVLLSINMVYQHSMQVNLAEARSGKAQPSRDESTVITVREDGTLYLDREEIDAGTLRERLEVLRESRPDLRVRIHADGKAAHAEVIEAVDAVRQSGVEDVIFSVRPDR